MIKIIYFKTVEDLDKWSHKVWKVDKENVKKLDGRQQLKVANYTNLSNCKSFIKFIEEVDNMIQ